MAFIMRCRKTWEGVRCLNIAQIGKPFCNEHFIEELEKQINQKDKIIVKLKDQVGILMGEITLDSIDTIVTINNLKKEIEELENERN